MPKIDTEPNKSNNSDKFIVIEGDGQQVKINKKDMVWHRVGGHKHHYLPDFTDETDIYVALMCGVRGCPHGVLHRKEGKAFMGWLDKHRTKA